MTGRNLQRQRLNCRTSGNQKRQLGMILANTWSFKEHNDQLHRRAQQRLHTLRKASNSNWGLGNRVLTITAHALVESLLSYGSTTYGSAASGTKFHQLDTVLLNPKARRAVGPSMTVRREALFPLADLRTTANRYVEKGPGSWIGPRELEAQLLGNVC